MSGGSWDYVHRQFEEVATRLQGSRDPIRRTFGDHVAQIAETMRVIEWVDSGDSTTPSDAEAIKSTMGAALAPAVVERVRREATELRKLLDEMIGPDK